MTDRNSRGTRKSVRHQGHDGQKMPVKTEKCPSLRS
jgi:hypothetical protein